MDTYYFIPFMSSDPPPPSLWTGESAGAVKLRLMVFSSEVSVAKINRITR